MRKIGSQAFQASPKRQIFLHTFGVQIHGPQLLRAPVLDGCEGSSSSGVGNLVSPILLIFPSTPQQGSLRFPSKSTPLDPHPLTTWELYSFPETFFFLGKRVFPPALPQNLLLLKALWSLSYGIWSVLKGSREVLAGDPLLQRSVS